DALLPPDKDSVIAPERRSSDRAALHLVAERRQVDPAVSREHGAPASRRRKRATCGSREHLEVHEAAWAIAPEVLPPAGSRVGLPGSPISESHEEVAATAIVILGVLGGKDRWRRPRPGA